MGTRNGLPALDVNLFMKILNQTHLQQFENASFPTKIEIQGPWHGIIDQAKCQRALGEAKRQWSTQFPQGAQYEIDDFYHLIMRWLARQAKNLTEDTLIWQLPNPCCTKSDCPKFIFLKLAVILAVESQKENK